MRDSMVFQSTAGELFPVEIKRRKGARYLRVRFGLSNQLKVSAPWHTSDRKIQTFIDSQRNWIEAHLVKLPRVVTLHEWFYTNPFCSVGGVQMSVRVLVSHTPRLLFETKYETGEIHFYAKDEQEASLEHVVRQAAKSILCDRTAHLAEKLGLSYSGVSVRNQTTRWGSCSMKRQISLNWRLLLLEPGLQDYVILHELAHLTEMNHGRAFWNLLESYDPEFESHEKQLTRIGAEVLRVGRSAKM